MGQNLELIFPYGIGASQPSQAPSGVTNPRAAMDHIIQFMNQIVLKNIPLNKEQLCTLIFKIFKPFNDQGTALIQPYKKIQAFELISKMEQQTSRLINTSYIDELQDIYRDYFEFLKKEIV